MPSVRVNSTLQISSEVTAFRSPEIGSGRSQPPFVAPTPLPSPSPQRHAGPTSPTQTAVETKSPRKPLTYPLFHIRRQKQRHLRPILQLPGSPRQLQRATSEHNHAAHPPNPEPNGAGFPLWVPKRDSESAGQTPSPTLALPRAALLISTVIAGGGGLDCGRRSPYWREFQ